MSKFDVTDRYARCPRCTCEYGKRVNMLLLLGPIGDALFHPVKCVNCSTIYNGKTGKANGLARFGFACAMVAVGIFIAVLMKDLR